MLPVRAGQGRGGSVIRYFFFRCGIFFLEVVFFLRSQSLFLKRCFIFFFRFAADYFLESHLKFWSLSNFFLDVLYKILDVLYFFLEVLSFFSASKKTIFASKKKLSRPKGGTCVCVCVFRLLLSVSHFRFFLVYRGGRKSGITFFVVVGMRWGALLKAVIPPPPL